jgi:hypothetical protein
MQHTKKTAIMNGRQRKIPALLALVVVIAVALFLTVFKDKDSSSTENLTVQPAASLAVPESSATAKEYIDRASQEADKNDYAQAISIMDEGLQRFPEDQNLKLTKEYYENQAKAYEE